MRKRNRNTPEEFECKAGNLPAEAGCGLAGQGMEGVGHTPPGEPPASLGLGGRLLWLVRHLVTTHCPIYTVQWVKCSLPSFPKRRKFTEAPWWVCESNHLSKGLSKGLTLALISGGGQQLHFSGCTASYPLPSL